MFSVTLSLPLTGILLLDVFIPVSLRHSGPSASPFSFLAISFRVVIFLHSLLLLLRAALLHKHRTFSFAFLSGLCSSFFPAAVPSPTRTFVFKMLLFGIFLQTQFLSPQSSFYFGLPSFPSFPSRHEIPHPKCSFTFPLTAILRLSHVGSRATKLSEITLLAPPYLPLLSFIPRWLLTFPSSSFLPFVALSPLHNATNITTAKVLKISSRFLGIVANT